MTIDFTKKHLIAIALIIIVIVLSFGTVYFFIIKDKNEMLAREVAELTTIEQQLSIIENRVTSVKDKIIINSTEIQKEVPVEPLVEQLILDIDRAEFISKSRVSQLSIGSTSDEVSFPKKEEEKTETDEAMEDASDNFADFHGDPSDKIEQQLSGEEKEEEQSNQATETANKSYPYGMKMIRVNISAEADNYFEMEKFIEVLQSLQRIIRFDSISFNGKPEITHLQQDDDTVSFNLSLTAFYYPKLTALLDELPKLDVPNQSNKHNPFVNFSPSDLDAFKKRQEELEGAEEEKRQEQENNNNEIDDSLIDDNNNSYPPVNMGDDNENSSQEENPTLPEQPNDEVVKYTVKRGDNLFRIAIQHYGDGLKYHDIKRVNNLISNIIVPGQILTLP